MPSSEVLASNHHYHIPRMAFEFDPTGVGKQNEFSITLPTSDVDGAEPLTPPLEYLPELLTSNFRETLLESSQKNEGGEISVNETENEVVVSFGFGPLPQRAEPPTYSTFSNYFEKISYLQQPRRLQLDGRHELFTALTRITCLQYQYAVSPDNFRPEFAMPPSRFSFVDGANQEEPRFIIGEEFEKTRTDIMREETNQLTQDAFDYLSYLDPWLLNDPYRVLGSIAIPAPGRIFGDGGHSSFGQRGEELTRDDIDDIDIETDFRLQPGDLYIARGHNLELVSSPLLIAMVAVGSINRLCRERRLATPN